MKKHSPEFPSGIAEAEAMLSIRCERNNMIHLKLDGVWAAVWTPVDGNGELRESALEKNLSFTLSHGVNGLMVLGSTGEFPHLSLSLRQRVMEKVVALAQGKPVIANVSDIRPRDAIALGKFAKQLGAAAISLLPPYFFPLSQDDLLEFFVRVGEASELPVVLYNFPERTGHVIELDTLSRAADELPLAGIKHSGADFDYLRPLVELGRSKGFSVLTGNEIRLRDALCLGAVGCVSGLANVVPDLIVPVFRAGQVELTQTVLLCMERLRSMGQHIDGLTFPLNVAAAMEARGLDPGAPKALVSRATQQRYQDLVQALRQAFREWNLRP
ncbi:MAG: dihydrodipicolinate synthase family protein [Verrucomicrobiota bacterium]